MHDRFLKDKPFFIRCNTFSSCESRSQIEQIQESKRDKKQPIEKQHADNQSEEDTRHRGGKGKKWEETESRKKDTKIKF